VDEPQLKIPNRVHQPQSTKQASNGMNPNKEKNCQFLLVYFEDYFRAKFGAKAFHFREAPVPTCQSTFHNLEGTAFLFLPLFLFLSHLKSERRPNI
jgi:hypothetical protein